MVFRKISHKLDTNTDLFLFLDRSGTAFDFSSQHLQRKSRVSFVSSHDLNHSYETNFANVGGHPSRQILAGEHNTSATIANQVNGNIETSASNIIATGAPGTPRAVENIIVTTIYRKVVSKLVEKHTWLKLPENESHYVDVRGLMHYVKQWHGGIFRRVVLSGMLDSTRKLVKTHYKIDVGFTTSGGTEGGHTG